MVIVLPDGSFILESGDPNFESVSVGNDAPQNDVIDPLATKSVSQLVLEAFEIPFDALSILGGILPGHDIKNQDPATMLKLSLATELLDIPDGSAGFAEVELDEFGIARFYVAGDSTADDLDIRYCIPTSQVTTPADLVIVRGFDPSPRRELRDTFDGLQNAELMDYGDCAGGSCDEKAVGKFATISYDDPLLDQTYLDDIRNSYELKAFESLIGYIVDLDLPDGADRDDPNFIFGLKLTFGDTTREYIQASADLLSRFIRLPTVGGSTLTGLFGTSGGLTASLGGSAGGAAGAIGVSGPLQDTGPGNSSGSDAGTIPTGTNSVVFGSVNGGGGTITASVTVVDENAGVCTTKNVAVAGSKIVIPVSRFERLNKFGNLESDFIGVSEIIFTGRKVVTFTIFGDLALDIFVKPQKELINLQHGKNWIWDIDENGNVEIDLFSILEDDFSRTVCDVYQGNIDVDTIALHSTDTPNQTEVSGIGALSGLVCSIGDRLGYLVLDNRLCIVVERKRPSVDIFDPTGNAGIIARQFIDPNGPFGIRYTPVVIIDEPAPIAYAATDPLSNSPEAAVPRTIPAEGIIDQADGIVDADPTTTQALADSELSILQDNTNGATIDITLPFCTDQECLQIAKNFLGLQSGVVNTQSIILGPTSEPRLGQVMPDDSIINEISYSYSDSSQYLITIATGPKYLTAGSFNDSKYQLRTEDVTREGVVLQDVGNGAEYVVRIEGFGEITALSMVVDDISVGDKVNVRIYNNPVERI